MSTLKHKGKGPQSMTANELKDGYSVWLNKTFNWTRDFSEALCTEDSGLIEKMGEIADRDVAANIVVGTYYIDIEPDTGLPVRYREKFRVKGPSYDTADLLEIK